MSYLSKFDLKNYNSNKISIEKDLKKILPNWESTQGFISDGLFNPLEYNNSKLKVLFILGEYYDHEKDGMIDISWQIEKYHKFYDFWGVDNSKYPHAWTSKKIPAFLWYLYNHFENDSLKNKDCFIEEDRTLFRIKGNSVRFNSAQESFAKCGIIEINKAGTSISDNKQSSKRIFEGARIFKDVIKKQIEIISPNLIIICSNDVLNSIKKENIINDSDIPKEKNILVKNNRNQYIIHTKHPTRWSYDDIYSIYKTIVNNISFA